LVISRQISACYYAAANTDLPTLLFYLFTLVLTTRLSSIHPYILSYLLNFLFSIENIFAGNAYFNSISILKICLDLVVMKCSQEVFFSFCSLYLHFLHLFAYFVVKKLNEIVHN